MSKRDTLKTSKISVHIAKEVSTTVEFHTHSPSSLGKQKKRVRRILWWICKHACDASLTACTSVVRRCKPTPLDLIKRPLSCLNEANVNCGEFFQLPTARQTFASRAQNEVSPFFLSDNLGWFKHTSGSEVCRGHWRMPKKNFVQRLLAKKRVNKSIVNVPKRSQSQVNAVGQPLPSSVGKVDVVPAVAETKIHTWVDETGRTVSSYTPREVVEKSRLVQSDRPRFVDQYNKVIDRPDILIQDGKYVGRDRVLWAMPSGYHHPVTKQWTSFKD